MASGREHVELALPEADLGFDRAYVRCCGSDGSSPIRGRLPVAGAVVGDDPQIPALVLARVRVAGEAAAGRAVQEEQRTSVGRAPLDVSELPAVGGVSC